MDNALYTWVASLGVSPLNTVLLGIIALLARQRIVGLVDSQKECDERTDRIEDSLLAAGIKLLPKEDYVSRK